ncbi:hypothetical protein [Kangiella marina]|uniref:Uncharacterized protein n=1 Tax=Kangiella marina TaxID=1079178 RepID=A0ABP8IJA2_9GAMM
MKRFLKEITSSNEIDHSPHYLLSQELEFEFTKSILTFALAFIGGIVSLKTVLTIESASEDHFFYAIAAAILSALFAFESQQGIINDLRVGRSPSRAKRFYRRTAAPIMLGTAIGFAVTYFEVI